MSGLGCKENEGICVSGRYVLERVYQQGGRPDPKSAGGLLPMSSSFANTAENGGHWAKARAG